MKTLSTKMTRNTRVAYFALAALAGSQTVYAQANDATFNITGTVPYTHLTLPTNRKEGISAVSVTVKKQQKLTYRRSAA